MNVDGNHQCAPRTGLDSFLLLRLLLRLAEADDFEVVMVVPADKCAGDALFGRDASVAGRCFTLHGPAGCLSKHGALGSPHDVDVVLTVGPGHS